MRLKQSGYGQVFLYGVAEPFGTFVHQGQTGMGLKIFCVQADHPLPGVDGLSYIPLPGMGFAGVQNFPTVGLIDGVFRANLEETGMGYGLEVEMIRAARALDMLTTPYVFSAEDGQPIYRPWRVIEKTVTATTPDGKTVRVPLRIGAASRRPRACGRW